MIFLSAHFVPASHFFTMRNPDRELRLPSLLFFCQRVSFLLPNRVLRLNCSFRELVFEMPDDKLISKCKQPLCPILAAVLSPDFDRHSCFESNNLIEIMERYVRYMGGNTSLGNTFFSFSDRLRFPSSRSPSSFFIHERTENSVRVYTRVCHQSMLCLLS